MCIYMLQLKNYCSIRVVPIIPSWELSKWCLCHTQNFWYGSLMAQVCFFWSLRIVLTRVCVYRPLENSITRSYSENYYTPDMVCSVIHFFCFCVNMCVQYERKSPSVLIPLQCYTVCVFTEGLFPNTCPCFDMPPLPLSPPHLQCVTITFSKMTSCSIVFGKTTGLLRRLLIQPFSPKDRGYMAGTLDVSYTHSSVVRT